MSLGNGTSKKFGGVVAPAGSVNRAYGALDDAAFPPPLDDDEQAPVTAAGTRRRRSGSRARAFIVLVLAPIKDCFTYERSVSFAGRRRGATAEASYMRSNHLWIGMASTVSVACAIFAGCGSSSSGTDTPAVDSGADGTAMDAAPDVKADTSPIVDSGPEA